MPNNQQNKRDDPYIGPRAFGRNHEDQNRFFGRDQEVDEIVNLIFSHQAVLIYAQSGAGKTSILNAQVIPQLEKKRIRVLPVATVGIFSSVDNNIPLSSSDSIVVNKSGIYMLNACFSMKPDF